MNLNEDIKAEALSLGFSLAGVSAVERPPHVQTYLNWLGLGRHGDMAYLATETARDRRANPAEILDGARSMLVVGMHYPDPASAPAADLNRAQGRTASYAWGTDYHELIPRRLDLLATRISKALSTPVRRRAYTDTGPILERDFAQKAGLGWAGKNTCLINPGQGSFLFLGVLFSDAELEPDQTFNTDHCGTCTRCVEACPTHCIEPDRTIDARRCISYQTIENKGLIPVDLRSDIGDWVFGCDVCQMVCPWNIRFSRPHTETSFDPRQDVPRPVLVDELALSPQDFNQKFKNSPVKRAKRRGYLRNVTVALGNSGDVEGVVALIATLENESEPLVRAHAAWALGQLGGRAARLALDKASLRENNEMVLLEVRRALERGSI